MEQASLDKALDAIMNSNIKSEDKLELLINLNTFFANYNDNIIVLNRYERNKKTLCNQEKIFMKRL